MLSYQHGYHAGNFADVIKHLALTRLLNYLTLKEKPLFYLETHSGKGVHDLKNKQAEKTGEYKQGIQLLWDNQKQLPALFQDYLRIVKGLNPTKALRYYPGSPSLTINTLRPEDRMYFCEPHPAEFDTLATLPRLHKKVHFSNTDGMTAMRALLPPPEKRGLVFIDPSFEVKEEYRDIPVAIKQAFTRFSNGTFCLWYPIVNQRMVDKLARHMKEINASSALRIEFHLSKGTMQGMSGMGLWMINPPYTFAEEMKSLLNALKTYFNLGTSSYTIETY